MLLSGTVYMKQRSCYNTLFLPPFHTLSRKFLRQIRDIVGVPEPTGKKIVKRPLEKEGSSCLRHYLSTLMSIMNTEEWTGLHMHMEISRKCVTTGCRLGNDPKCLTTLSSHMTNLDMKMCILILHYHKISLSTVWTVWVYSTCNWFINLIRVIMFI